MKTHNVTLNIDNQGDQRHEMVMLADVRQMENSAQRPPPAKRLVMLWWDDSFGGGSWISKEDQENRVVKCLTAGFLIGETDEHITVTCSMTEGGEGEYLGPITIPKSCITRREDLKQNK